MIPQDEKKKMFKSKSQKSIVLFLATIDVQDRRWVYKIWGNNSGWGTASELFPDWCQWNQ